MHYELDHVFVAVSTGGPEAEDLVASGFMEGTPNAHPGQGTACRRFFFERSYIEFLWLESRVEASSPGVARTGLVDRANQLAQASHIGLCVRSATRPVPTEVPTWPYSPRYLHGAPPIAVAASSRELATPLVFFTSAEGIRGREGARHPNGAQAISNVRLTVPEGQRDSVTLEWLADAGLVELGYGEGEALVVEFDGCAQGRELELMTVVPMRLKW